MHLWTMHLWTMHLWVLHRGVEHVQHWHLLHFVHELKWLFLSFLIVVGVFAGDCLDRFEGLVHAIQQF